MLFDWGSHGSGDIHSSVRLRAYHNIRTIQPITAWIPFIDSLNNEQSRHKSGSLATPFQRVDTVHPVAGFHMAAHPTGANKSCITLCHFHIARGVMAPVQSSKHSCSRTFRLTIGCTQHTPLGSEGS